MNMKPIKFSTIWKHDTTGEITESIIELKITERWLSLPSESSNNKALLAVRQYTGQNTKDGKEIYDGDILMGRYQEGGGPEAIHGVIHAAVSWDSEWGKWIVTEIGSEDKWDLYDYAYIDTVIGNIYRNKNYILIR